MKKIYDFPMMIVFQLAKEDVIATSAPQAVNGEGVEKIVSWNQI